MPILTNHEVAEFRKMTAFACRLLDLCDEVHLEQDFMLVQKRFDIADELGIKLPLEEGDEQQS